jgi:hypothetical protein
VSSFGRWAAYEAAAHVAGPYARAYVDIADTASRARGRLRDAYVGCEMLKQDGRRGEHAVSAGEWFHGASDRAAALGQISADFHAFLGDLNLHATSPADAAWIAAVVKPTIDDWQEFANKQGSSTLSPWVTEWSVYESWQERLRRLRELAHSRGIVLESPDPVPLPKTIWQRGREGEGGGVDVMMGLVKTMLFGVLALTGVVGFYVLVRDVRGRGDRMLHK